MTPEYAEFLARKTWDTPAAGVARPYWNWIPPGLFPFQNAIVRWALGKGRAAIFADTGLGKTRMQASWANCVHAATSKPSLILCPLAVAAQTVKEAREKLGITINLCQSQGDLDPSGLNIANYDKLHRFEPDALGSIVLDESSILKAFDGSTRQALQEFAETIPYRLALTATPAPNDHTEIGNHAEFLGVMTRTEMLATWFTHDGGDTSKWRLKGHAVESFWEWVGSWAIACRKPSDVGAFDDTPYQLPPLSVLEHCVDSPAPEPGKGGLFGWEAATLTEQRTARRGCLSVRVAQMARLVLAEPSESWVIWAELNDEADALVAAIPGAVQVRGADKPEQKETVLTDFAEGRLRVLVTKPSIAGFGLNWQHCARVGFVGVSHSYEAFYQAVRRCYRFGQAREVVSHLIYSDAEGVVLRNLQRKAADADTLTNEMVAVMKKHQKLEAGADAEATERQTDSYQTAQETGARFTLYRGDTVELMPAKLQDNSVGYSIFSPPFASLYTYSNSARDLGNSRSDGEFMEHFRFIVSELFRVAMPGRLVSFHCMNLPAAKVREGYIGLRDFRGDLIRLFQDSGFIFHSEAVIWKDPVAAMQRTKALGLLHKTLEKDSAMSRQGIPDYLVTMRKPGLNPEPVAGRLDGYFGEEVLPGQTSWYCSTDKRDWAKHKGAPIPTDEKRGSIEIWQRYASPVWWDIDPSDTLQYMSAREHADERHICPLQLGVIRRGLQLWSNPGDLVLSPFAGIGSEGYVALQMGRRFVGMELKGSYYEQAGRNLRRAETESGQTSIFDVIDEPISAEAETEALLVPA